MTDLTKAEVHDLCAALLDEANKGYKVGKGWAPYHQFDAALLPSTLATNFPELAAKIPNFGTPVLRAAAKAGKIAEVKVYNRWQFMSARVAAEWAAESALSDGERAERTTAAVEARFEQNRAEYGDDVRRWAVNTNSAAIPQDGIKPAIDAGLLIKPPQSHRLFGGGVDVVPASWADTYAELLEQDARRDAVIAERHRVMVGQLEGMIGPVHNRGGPVSLDDSQLERLLKVVGRSTGTLGTVRGQTRPPHR